MKNLKKLDRKDLKKVQGGRVPICCLDWNPFTRKCLTWDMDCLNG